VADGVIGPVTWNTIVTQYNNIKATSPTPIYPGTPLRQGSTGENVRTLQTYINRLAGLFSSVPRVIIDGMFGPATTAAVIAAQRTLGLTADGIVGLVTWNAIVTNNPTVRPPYTIVLDPGHGGADFGAFLGTRLEKNDNLNMALAVHDRLQAQGQRVILTRSTDEFLSLAERSIISNNNNADIFVSFHRNASTSPNANGMETIVQIDSPPVNTVYARNVQNEVVAAGVQTNLGVREDDFAVLRNTRAPAMLVELGFITNVRDNELFDFNFEAYADAIARGIMKSVYS
jgi:N-acetylmuramoyl-L-alanine amidase